MEALEPQFLQQPSCQLASPYYLNWYLSGILWSNTEEGRRKEQSIREIGMCEVNLHCQLDGMHNHHGNTPGYVYGGVFRILSD